jgi:hypothetical protein
LKSKDGELENIDLDKSKNSNEESLTLTHNKTIEDPMESKPNEQSIKGSEE